MTSRARAAYATTPSRQENIRRLVIAHLPLVKRIASHAMRSLAASVSEEDLIGAGTLGLIEAAQRYDATKGVKFVTFAYTRVRGEIMDHLRRNDCLAKRARSRLRGLRGAISAFQSERGRKPGIGELAEQMSMSGEDVLKYLSYERWSRVASLDGSTKDGEGGEGALKALLAADTETPLAKLEKSERMELLRAAIEALPEREKRIIVMYYYEDLYVAEIATILSISESRVSQLHTRALYNLARHLQETP